MSDVRNSRTTCPETAPGKHHGQSPDRLAGAQSRLDWETHLDHYDKRETAEEPVRKQPRTKAVERGLQPKRRCLAQRVIAP